MQNLNIAPEARFTAPAMSEEFRRFNPANVKAKRSFWRIVKEMWDSLA